HATRKIKVVRKSGPDDLVFQPLYGGKVMRDNNILSRHIKPAARKLSAKCVNCGLQPEDHEKVITCPCYQKGPDYSFVNWRCLRTSYATWLITAGADPKSTQAQLRHATIKPTLDIYAQFVPESQKRAVEKLPKLATERIQ